MEQAHTDGRNIPRGGYLWRIVRLVLGLVLFSFGSYLTIQANIGLAPWEAFSMGVSGALNMRYGDVLVLSGFVILLIDLLLKEKIGLGTILDMLLVGKCVDFFRAFGGVPMMQRFLPGLAILLLGQVFMCIASYLYISVGFSCGPRDLLMVALDRRLKKAPIGLIRGLIEGSVLLVGFLLGAKVGVGTVIAVFGIGFILQFTFRVLHFDVGSVEQENIMQTMRGIFGGGRKQAGEADK